MLVDLSDKRLELEYPCEWLYKVISTDHDGDRRRIVAMLQDCRCSITVSNSSRSGKYTCLNVTIQVSSEAHRQTIFGLLQGLETVKMVL